MRLLKNTRLHLLLLAFSLFTISTILGLSAYLADKQVYQANFRTATSDELGFAFTAESLTDKLLTPGETLSMPVGVKVSGPNSLYAFIEFDPPEGLTVNGFSSSWLPIEEGSNIYYYGTSSGLYTLDKDNNPEVLIFEGVTLPKESQTGESYPLSITGYAIQSDEIAPNTSPKAVFDMAVENIKNP